MLLRPSSQRHKEKQDFELRWLYPNTSYIHPMYPFSNLKGGGRDKNKKTASPALIHYELIHQPRHTKGFKSFPSPISWLDETEKPTSLNGTEIWQMSDTSCYIWQRNLEPIRADLSVYTENAEAQNPGHSCCFLRLWGLERTIKLAKKSTQGNQIKLQNTTCRTPCKWGGLKQIFNETARWHTNAGPKMAEATMLVPTTPGPPPAAHGSKHRTRVRPCNPHSSPTRYCFSSSF